jgi:hypothetical protein
MRCTGGDVKKLRSDFENSGLPYFVDIVIFPELRHPELKEHILRAGVEIYKK